MDLNPYNPYLPTPYEVVSYKRVAPIGAIALLRDKRDGLFFWRYRDSTGTWDTVKSNKVTSTIEERAEEYWKQESYELFK